MKEITITLKKKGYKILSQLGSNLIKEDDITSRRSLERVKVELPAFFLKRFLQGAKLRRAEALQSKRC